MKILFLLPLLTIFLLTSCGQSGNLYLPSPKGNKQHAKDTYLITGNNATTKDAAPKKETSNNPANTAVVIPNNNTAVSSGNSSESSNNTTTPSTNKGVSTEE